MLGSSLLMMMMGQATPAAPVMPPIAVRPLRASGIYALGERAGWMVTVPQDVAITPGAWRYSLKRNDAVEIASGTLDLARGSATIETVGREPQMLFLRISPANGNRSAVRAFGAAIAPTALKPVNPKPKDFDAFWKRKIADLHRVPENAVVTPGKSPEAGVEYATIRMDHVNQTRVYGQIAKPARAGKFPAILMLQWAGGPYPLDPSWIAWRAKQGYLILDIQAHDALPTEPQAYYDALPAYLKNYHQTGWESRETSAFVEMYLRDYRAVDYLTKRPDWDGKTLIVMGTSMGGQQSLAVAGLHPRITHMIVNVPAGCDLNAPLHGRSKSYPFFPGENAKVMETARYVDAVNFAPKIRAKSLVGMGFVDDVSAPAGIWTAFNEIKGPKEAAPMVDSPHNHLATPEQQRPYTSREATWLDAIVKGKPIPAPAK